jgi:hypothetical protein
VRRLVERPLRHGELARLAGCEQRLEQAAQARLGAEVEAGGADLRPAARRLDPGDGEELVRGVGREPLPRVDDCGRMLPGPAGGVRGHARDRIRHEHEVGDDPEVAAAAAAAGPEEVGVLVFAAGPPAPVRRDERQLLERIAGEAVLARDEPDAAAERDAGDAHRGAGPGGNRGLELPEPIVDAAELGAGADLGTRRKRHDPVEP